MDSRCSRPTSAGFPGEGAEIRSGEIMSDENAERNQLGRNTGVAAHKDHTPSISSCVLRVTRHGAESGPCSGTLPWMRVVRRRNETGVAHVVMPHSGTPLARIGTGFMNPPCSRPHGTHRTVGDAHTPWRRNRPEALVGVTLRQSGCRGRRSHSVTPLRREALCPPVRMV